VKIILFIFCLAITISAIAQPPEEESRQDTLNTIFTESYLTDVEKIMDKVRENFDDNHLNAVVIADFQLEKQEFINVKQAEIELKKASTLSQINLSRMKKRVDSFADLLINAPVRLLKRANGKAVLQGYSVPRIDMDSAISYSDHPVLLSRNATLDQLRDMMGKLGVAKGKRYKFSSGWLPISKEVSFYLDDNGRFQFSINKVSSADGIPQPDIKRAIVAYISEVGYGEHRYNEENPFPFLNDQDDYEFTLEALIEEENIPYYLISFRPDSWSSTYSGTLRVDATNFGVEEMDYRNADGEAEDKVNLKLLLGVKQIVQLRRHHVKFKYDDYSQTYLLDRATHQKRIYLYLNRPLKIKEKERGGDKIKLDLLTEVEIISTDRVTISNPQNYDVPPMKIPASTGPTTYRMIEISRN